MATPAQLRAQLVPHAFAPDPDFANHFLPDGEAIHARTWDVDAISFGVPSSHGCLRAE
jgi:hypothetical protein